MSWHTISMRRWCVMVNREGTRLWLLCLGNSIIVSAPSLLAPSARSVRHAAHKFYKPREVDRSL